MKKFFLFLFVLVLICAAVFAAVILNPSETGVKWLSVTFSETLKEQNELLVYTGEKTGREIYQRNAPIVGTIQEVELPYTFSFDYSVDLSRAQVEVNGKIVYVRVPGPRLRDYKLTIVDNEVERSGGLVYLSPNKYTEIKQSLEQRLLGETQSNQQYTTDAWNVAVRNLTSLLTSVAQANSVDGGFTIEVIRDDTLLNAAPDHTETADTVPIDGDTPGTTAIPVTE